MENKEDVIITALIESDGNKFAAIHKVMNELGLSMKEAMEEIAAAYEFIDKYDGCESISFRELVELYDRDYASIKHKKTTIESNRATIQKNFSCFMDMKLNEITTLKIQEWIVSLSEENLCGKTIKNNVALLRSIMNQAITWNYLKENPAAKVTIPKSEMKEAAFYNEKQINELTDALENVEYYYYDYKVGMYIALFCGLRRGEICGLNVDDVDMENRLMHIRRNRLKVKGEAVFEDSPKTQKSVRTITVPRVVVNELDMLKSVHERLKTEAGKYWVESESLLRNRIGKPVNPKYYSDWVRDFVSQNDLEPITLHGLRHTHTSILTNSGANIEAVSYRLGHSNTTTTLNIYSHMFREQDYELSDIVDDLYNRIKDE